VRVPARRAFAEVLECVKSGKVVAVTSGEKAAQALAERPGFWGIKRVL
jgi:hypothetical protein